MPDNTPHSDPSTNTFHRVRSPCEVLREDYMRPRAMSAHELARRMGLPVGRIRRVLMGEPIDAECAIRLAVVFGTPALYWVALQTEFDMECARRMHEPGGFDAL
nr:HigA family addiction module antitoxin [Dyella sp. ASV24]